MKVLYYKDVTLSVLCFGLLLLINGTASALTPGVNSNYHSTVIKTIATYSV